MISLGGWLRGFQLGANSTAGSYTPNKARVLANVEILDYFLDRLSTLHPRLKKTEFVKTLTGRLKGIRNLIAENQGRVLTQDQIAKIRDLANEAEAGAVAKVNEDGNFETPKR